MLLTIHSNSWLIDWSDYKIWSTVDWLIAWCNTVSSWLLDWSLSTTRPTLDCLIDHCVPYTKLFHFRIGNNQFFWISTGKETGFRNKISIVFKGLFCIFEIERNISTKPTDPIDTSSHRGIDDSASSSSQFESAHHGNHSDPRLGHKHRKVSTPHPAARATRSPLAVSIRHRTLCTLRGTPSPRSGRTVRPSQSELP